MKRNIKKLKLNREVVRVLESSELESMRGGLPKDTNNCGITDPLTACYSCVPCTTF